MMQGMQQQASQQAQKDNQKAADAIKQKDPNESSPLAQDNQSFSNGGGGDSNSKASSPSSSSSPQAASSDAVMRAIAGVADSGSRSRSGSGDGQGTANDPFTAAQDLPKQITSGSANSEIVSAQLLQTIAAQRSGGEGGGPVTGPAYGGSGGGSVSNQIVDLGSSGAGRGTPLGSPLGTPRGLVSPTGNADEDNDAGPSDPSAPLRRPNGNRGRARGLSTRSRPRAAEKSQSTPRE